MFIIYDLIFLTVLILFLPTYLIKGKFHSGFTRRLGILPKGLDLGHPIWIHAVSVGEVMAIRGLLEELRNTYPQRRFVISTVTPTGNKVAKNIATGKDFVTYLPLDFSFIVGRVLNKIKPSLFILAETEIWPNLINWLYQKQIPVIVVNARISDSSFRGYSCLKFLLQNILNKINLFCVQTESDAQRLKLLGVSLDKIKITGNMKFDINDHRDYKKDYTDLRLKLGIKGRFWVAGSTHPGEEKIILKAYKNLLGEFKDLRLLIVPRHPQRAKEIAKIVTDFGFNSRRISQLNSSAHQPISPSAVFILDTVGELIWFYSIADIVFVGGSLVKKGGHNILEPAILGKPVLFGPHMFNFRDIASLFLQEQAAILVRDEEDLKAKIKKLLNNPQLIDSLSQKAKKTVILNQGATPKNTQIIKGLCASICTD